MQIESKVPELNFRVIVTGIFLSIIMASANVYLGLKAGMTVSASIPAAVLGMVLLRQMRVLSRNSDSGSILEANQIQTAASAGEVACCRHNFYYARVSAYWSMGRI